MSDEYSGGQPAGMNEQQSDPSATPAAAVAASAPPKKPAGVWWAVAAGVVLVIAAVLVLRTPNVEVPTVVGLSQEDAEKALVLAGLRSGTVKDLETLEVAPDTVVEQTPSSGETVPEGTSVDLSVSATPVVEVPDVIGMTLSEAEETVAAATLRPGTVTYEFDAGVEAGRVIAQSPDPGTELPVASAVDVTVSMGAEQDQVPNVVGLPQTDATDALAAAGFTVKTTMAESDSVPAGDVIAQSPAAGAMVSPGSTVTLTVSTGAPAVVPPVDSGDSGDSGTPEAPVEPPSTTTAVPDVVGLGILEGIRALRDAELKVDFDFGPSDEYVLKIAAQDPEADAEVDRGSVVTVTIGLPEWLFDVEIQPLPTPLPSENDSGSVPSTSSP